MSRVCHFQFLNTKDVPQIILPGYTEVHEVPTINISVCLGGEYSDRKRRILIGGNFKTANLRLSSVSGSYLFEKIRSILTVVQEGIISFLKYCDVSAFNDRMCRLAT